MHKTKTCFAVLRQSGKVPTDTVRSFVSRLSRPRETHSKQSATELNVNVGIEKCESRELSQSRGCDEPVDVARDEPDWIALRWGWDKDNSSSQVLQLSMHLLSCESRVTFLSIRSEEEKTSSDSGH